MSAEFELTASVAHPASVCAPRSRPAAIAVPAQRSHRGEPVYAIPAVFDENVGLIVRPPAPIAPCPSKWHPSQSREDALQRVARVAFVARHHSEAAAVAYAASSECTSLDITPLMKVCSDALKKASDAGWSAPSLALADLQEELATRLADACAAGASLPGQTEASQFARAMDPSFWVRRFNREGKQASEAAAIRSGQVGAHGDLYVSDRTLGFYRAFVKAQKEFLQKTYLIDKTTAAGKRVKLLLADVAKSEEAERAKLWAFLKGIDEVAIESGLQCALVTLTLPSQYHAKPTSGAGGYDGVSTPLDGHKYLCSAWNKLQRDLDNKGIALSGARFVEAHKDGTPHWHVLTYFAPQHLEAILGVLARYFPGNAARGVAAVRVRSVEEDRCGSLHSKRSGKRFTQRYQRFDLGTGLVSTSQRLPSQVDVSIINRDYASGATYAAKYAMKTLEPGAASERLAAWRWCWSMRAFQLFGVRKCLSAWDELFRAKEEPKDPQARALWDAVHSKPGKHTREALNRATGKHEEFSYEGGTAAFIRLQGGLAAAGRSRSHLQVKRTYRQALGAGQYGDDLQRPQGIILISVARGSTGRLLSSVELHRCTTRDLDRWALVAEANVDAAFAALLIPEAAPRDFGDLTLDEIQELLYLEEVLGYT